MKGHSESEYQNSGVISEDEIIVHGTGKVQEKTGIH